MSYLSYAIDLASTALSYISDILSLALTNLIEAFRVLAALINADTTPILIATGAILTLISLRNAHLSERARGCINERLYSLPSCKHLLPQSKQDRDASLKDKSKLFRDRYEKTSRAFIYATLSFVLFALSSLLTGRVPPHENPLPKDFRIPAGIIGVVATAYSSEPFPC